MTVLERPRARAVIASDLRGWVTRHPLISFFVLAYVLSWSAWLPAFVGVDMILLGVFGPPLAALIVTHYTGGSVREWAASIVRWQIRPRFYLYALGLPAAIWTAMNVELAVIGEPIDPSVLPARVPAYLATFAFVFALGGGLEEPGWRGFALPHLQRRFSPTKATLILAFFWGLWHLPLYGAAFIGPMFFAFPYTFLYNRTRSVLPCILLHASFTAAQDHLVLLPSFAELSVALAMLGTLVAVSVALVVVTRGRLGLENERAR